MNLNQNILQIIISIIILLIAILYSYLALKNYKVHKGVSFQYISFSLINLFLSVSILFSFLNAYVLLLIGLFYLIGTYFRKNFK